MAVAYIGSDTLTGIHAELTMGRGVEVGHDRSGC